tara:strand:- start:5 stop:229 length:225 start_codon:yes stop_codon:yes gene_type:complete
MEQFKVGDLIKLKRPLRHREDPSPDDALAIVLSAPLSALFNRMKIQYFDKQQPYMTDPLLWKIVSRTSKMQKKC